jgi:hypothetical protein
MIRTRALSAMAALVAALTLGAVTTPVASATSAAWANDTFSLCSGTCKLGAARGTIAWGNRTANVNGSVSDASSELHTTVIFDAYAGNTHVDHQTRTASNTTKSYNFPIGDPDLVGGINRILITVCTTTTLGAEECNGPFEEVRN